MLINLSNHPLATWPKEQLEAAHIYGTMLDLPFPLIDSALDESAISDLANEYLFKIESISEGQIHTVIHIVGEMTFVFSLVTKLKARGYRCLASTTSRNVEILPDGRKISKFEFCRFREY